MLEKEIFDLKIGASRYGTKVLDVWSKVSQSLRNVESVLIAFGSPRSELKELLDQKGKTPDNIFDFFINTAPDQYVATVRTEEAVLTTSAVLNIMRVG